MPHATFRFYGELNHFLATSVAGRELVHEFRGTPAIKDSIEAIGVPHPEVALILINGEPATFESRLQAEARISVYPAFRRLPIQGAMTLQPAALAEAAFIADIHLGQLARYLRMVGFFCAYRNDAQDADLARQSGENDWVLLTRDQELLKRSIVRRGYFLRATDPNLQLVEVVRRFNLAEQIQPFRFCMECSGLLVEIDFENIKNELPTEMDNDQGPFRRCLGCRRVYWRGSHVERMSERIGWLRAQIEGAY